MPKKKPPGFEGVLAKPLSLDADAPPLVEQYNVRWAALLARYEIGENDPDQIMKVNAALLAECVPGFAFKTKSKVGRNPIDLRDLTIFWLEIEWIKRQSPGGRPMEDTVAVRAYDKRHKTGLSERTLVNRLIDARKPAKNLLIEKIDALPTEEEREAEMNRMFGIYIVGSRKFSA